MTKAASVEPRFARVAAAIGDPTRARMLSVLMGGVSLPAGEIAEAAHINPSTASEHLSRLVGEGLVAVEARGRHRYFRVSNGDVAHALEALSLLAERPLGEKWQREPYRRLKFARTCYRHLAGELGVRLMQALIGGGCLAAGRDGFGLTDAGHAWLEAIGMPAVPPRAAGRYAYACLDWSERREHLAGRLASALLEHFLARQWLARNNHPRALKLTAEGRRRLLPLLQGE